MGHGRGVRRALAASLVLRLTHLLLLLLLPIVLVLLFAALLAALLVAVLLVQLQQYRGRGGGVACIGQRQDREGGHRRRPHDSTPACPARG